MEWMSKRMKLERKKNYMGKRLMGRSVIGSECETSKGNNEVKEN